LDSILVNYVTMIVYILYGILFLVALFKERESLGCYLNFIRECDNKNGKAVVGTEVSEEESSFDILNKVEYASKAQERIVVWRFTFIIVAVSIFLAWFILFQTIPSEPELLGFTVVFCLLIIFSFGFYHYHLHRYIQQNIEKATDILRTRIQNSF
jgi:hypothetical protein